MLVNSKETILKNLLNAHKGVVIEGDPIYTIYSAIASALEREYFLREEQDKAFLLSDAKGEVLDEQCSWFGIYRLQGTYSQGQVKIITAPDKVIGGNGAEIYICDEDNREYMIEGGTANGEGELITKCIATEVGIQYNHHAGELFSTTSFEYDSITLIEPCIGGTNKESDDEFFRRFLYIQRTRGNAGNKKNYEEWALTIDGVYKAVAIELARGEGTVDIIISGKDNQPCSQEVIKECQKHIDEQKPIGANALVKSTSITTVTITGEIELYDTKQFEETKSRITNLIEERINSQLDLEMLDLYKSKVTALIEQDLNVKRSLNVTLDGSDPIKLDKNKVYSIKNNLTERK